MFKHFLNSLIACLFTFFLPSFTHANSSCSDAMLVTEGTYVVEAFTGTGAVFQGASAAAWYRFEPTEQGVFTVSSCEGGGDTRLVVLLLDDCAATDNLQIINSAADNCEDGIGGMTASSAEVVAVPGLSYVIYWDNGQSEDGFTWHLSFETETDTPVGAACETAELIVDGDHYIDSLTGIGAAFTDAVSAKWYAYTPEFDGILWINSCESPTDTRLFVWEGVCGELQILTQDDNGCEGSGGASLDGQLPIVEGGKTYFIYWDDHHSDEGFLFNVFLGPLPLSTIEPEWANTINLYPNPAVNQLYFDYEFDESTDILITIFNNLGQQMLVEKGYSLKKGQLDLAIDSLMEGIYFLTIKTNKAQVSRTFVVHK